jgi:hypothetical protein
MVVICFIHFLKYTVDLYKYCEKGNENERGTLATNGNVFQSASSCCIGIPNFIEFDIIMTGNNDSFVGMQQTYLPN